MPHMKKLKQLADNMRANDGMPDWLKDLDIGEKEQQQSLGTINKAGKSEYRPLQENSQENFNGIPMDMLSEETRKALIEFRIKQAMETK